MQGAHNCRAQGKGHRSAQDGHLLAVLQRDGKTFCQRMVAPAKRQQLSNHPQEVSGGQTDEISQTGISQTRARPCTHARSICTPQGHSSPNQGDQPWHASTQSKVCLCAHWDRCSLWSQAQSQVDSQRGLSFICLSITSYIVFRLLLLKKKRKEAQHLAVPFRALLTCRCSSTHRLPSVMLHSLRRADMIAASKEIGLLTEHKP